MPQQAAFLYAAEGEAANIPADIDWTRIDVAPLSIPTERPVGPSTLISTAWHLKWGRAVSITKQLDDFVGRGGRVAVCNDDAALSVAVAYRHFLGRPILPMRLISKPLAPQLGRFGRWFRNRACLAHVAADEEQAKIAAAHHDLHGYGLFALATPDSGDSQAGRDLLRRAIDITGSAPAGDEHILLSYVTHFYCNQQNADAVFELLRKYQSYGPALLDRVHFVIVDDGSPISYEIPEFDLNLTWVKIDSDIRWNQPGARNVGMIYARSDKVFLSDMDIEVPEDTLAYFVARRNRGTWMVRPSFRNSVTGRPLRRHPNVFLMSRGQFFKHFGYDEEFSGHYAFDDLRYTKHQKLWGTLLGRMPDRYPVYDRNAEEGKMSIHSLHRDGSFNALLNARKHFEVDWYGRNAGHSRSSLGFTWKVLLDHRRKRPAPRIDRMFKPTWYLRQIGNMFT